MMDNLQLKLGLLGFFLLGVVLATTAQFRSNKGKEFWLGYAHNFYFNDPEGNHRNGQTMVLYLTSERPTRATVRVNGTAWSQTVNIPGGGVDASIEIPKTGAGDARLQTEGLHERGIHIVAEDSIVAYAHQYGVQSSAAMLLFPVDTYGYSYTSMIYKQEFIQQSQAFVWTLIVAPENNTRVEIIPSEDTEGGRLAGVPFTIDLKKGEAYQLFGKIDENRRSKDLSGTKIKSIEGADGKCHPIAMYSGSSILRLCNGDGGEFMWQQMFPQSAWGTSYLTYKTVHPKGTLFQPYLNIYRVMVSDPATVVKVNGTPLTGLVKNTYYEFRSTTGDYIEADKPIMVTQYKPGSNQCEGVIDRNAYGDPEMFIITPMQQGIKSAVFYNTRRQNIDLNYFDLIIHKNGLPSLRFNGNPVPAANITNHPQNNDYAVVVIRLLGAGRHHTLRSDSTFYAKIYGYGAFESYGYNLGTMINNLNGIPELRNVYNNTQQKNTYTCPNSPFQVTVHLAYRATRILWEFSKASGINATADTVLNNPVPSDSIIIANRKYYTYTLPSSYYGTQPGLIEIPIWATAPEVDYCNKTEPFVLQYEVRPGPVSDFTIDYSGCISDTARFTGNPNPRNFLLDRYIWTHYDGQVDSAMHSKKKFIQGTHPVSFRVIADNGCLHDTIKTITTTRVPEAKFSVNKALLCIGDSVQFTDASDFPGGQLAEWHWNFDNGKDTMRTNANPFTYIYQNPGRYNVSLWVNSNNNCKSDSTFATIEVKEKPLASFTVAGRNCVDSVMVFTSTASAQGNTLQQWGWQFDNNPPILNSNNTPQSITYRTAGSGKQVLHWVSAGAGCNSDTASALAFSIYDNPIAGFSIAADSFCTATDIRFTNNGTSPEATVWQWDFGNGSGNVQPPFARTYNAQGNYTSTLRVFNPQGCGSAIASQTFEIFSIPSVDAGPDLTIFINQSTLIQASGTSGAGISYHWTPTIALNNPSILRPTASPEESTTFRIVATNQGNCAATDTMRITVFTGVNIPNAFSPNGDGLNDVWNIPGLAAYPNSVLRIFDRYGQVIYETKGFQRPWDGTKSGKPLPIGVYYYILDLGDGSEKKNGSIALLR
jgi:gliding motility-associated-like protein